MATYYVKNTGNDSNSGLSDALAWQTISKVNATTLSASDSVLFNRGDTWYENLLIAYSGENNLPITYGAYGTGNKPLISGMEDVPGWDVSENWVDQTGNIWRMAWDTWHWSVRILFDGVEKKRVVPMDSTAVTTDNPWSFGLYMDGSTQRTDYLYVYSTTNPATAFTSMKRTSSSTLFSEPTQKNYITFNGIDFEGWYQNLNRGCKNWIVENCDIGRYFSNYGLYFTRDIANDVHTENIIIRNNNIDSGDRIGQSLFYPDNSPHGYYRTYNGIRFRMGSKNIEIYGNNIYGWGHAGVEMIGSSTVGRMVENVKIYDNDISAEWQDYGRAFAIEGYNLANCNESSPIEIYNNRLYEQGVRSQIQAPFVKSYNNVWDKVNGSISNVLQTLAVNNYGGALPYRMKFYNNVFANASYDGLAFLCYISSTNSAEENEFVNNIIYSPGRRYMELVSSTKMINNVFNNNIFYGADDARIRFHNTHLDPAEYVFWTVAEFEALTEGDAINNPSNFITSGNIEADPLFVDPDNGDFTLRSGSPAINTGLAPLSANDHNGDVWTVPYHIGAFNYRYYRVWQFQPDYAAATEYTITFNVDDGVDPIEDVNIEITTL